MWSWGKKTLFTNISVLGWRVKGYKQYFPCVSALCFGSAPRTLKPGGLHTTGPNKLSLDFCRRWVQPFHRNIFYLLTLFWGLYNSPPDGSQVTWKDTQNPSPFQQNSQEPTIQSELREKNLVHKNLRFSPYISHEESIYRFINTFWKLIIPSITLFVLIHVQIRISSWFKGQNTTSGDLST